MPYDDATAVLPPMPEGYHSVMAGGGGDQYDNYLANLAAQSHLNAPEASPQERSIVPYGTADSEILAAHKQQALGAAQQQPDDPISYEKRFLPAQVSQITQLNSQKAAIAWALNQGQIRPQEARARMQSLDLQIKGIQPSMVPKMKPSPMHAEYPDRVYTDHLGNTFIRKSDGDWDVRPPSAHSSTNKLFDAQHDAAMGHAGEQQDAAEQWRDHHHEAQIAQGEHFGTLQQVQHQVEQEQAKAETERVKMQSAAQKAKHQADAAQQKQQQQFEDRRTKEAERLQEQSQKHVEATIKQQQQETDSAKKEYWQHVERLRKQTKQEADDAANAQYAATKKRVAPTYPSDDELHQRVIKDLSRFDPDFESKLMAKPKGQPTLAPPEPQTAAAPTATPAAAPTAAAPTPAAQAPQMAPHPAVRAEAPPEVHQARQQLDAWATQYGPDPAKWPPAILNQAKAISKQVRPWGK